LALTKPQIALLTEIALQNALVSAQTEHPFLRFVVLIPAHKIKWLIDKAVEVGLAIPRNAEDLLNMSDVSFLKWLETNANAEVLLSIGKVHETDDDLNAVEMIRSRYARSRQPAKFVINLG